MRIYQSSLGVTALRLIQEYAPDIKVNILRSFDLDNDETLRIINDYSANINSIILDSGVWFKYKQPEKYKDAVHNVKLYGEFAKVHGSKFECYFNYDEDFKEVFRDDYSSKNHENQRILEGMGLHPVPVLHLLDDELINYHVEQQAKYPLVAIGSNQVGAATFHSAVKKLYDNNVRVHGFRLGSSSKLLGLPAWSVDCSSHVQWTASGRAVVYDRVKGVEDGISFRPFSKTGAVNKDYYQISPLKEDFLWFLEEVVGVELEALIIDSTYRSFSNTLYYWWLERYVTCKNNGVFSNPLYDDQHFDPTNPLLDQIFSSTSTIKRRTVLDDL